MREVGALPEYSSREGCGVEVQDSREEGSREFGRLVIHRIHIGIALWTLSFWVPACELYIGISFLGFRRRLVINTMHIGIAFWSLSFWHRACELSPVYSASGLVRRSSASPFGRFLNHHQFVEPLKTKFLYTIRMPRPKKKDSKEKFLYKF